MTYFIDEYKPSYLIMIFIYDKITVLHPPQIWAIQLILIQEKNIHVNYSIKQLAEKMPNFLDELFSIYDSTLVSDKVLKQN